MDWAVFFMANDVEIMSKYGLEVNLICFRVVEHICVYNSCLFKEILNFASMIPHRSALGSPSKASELEFIILNKMKIGRAGGRADERTVGRAGGRTGISRGTVGLLRPKSPKSYGLALWIWDVVTNSVDPEPKV